MSTPEQRRAARAEAARLAGRAPGRVGRPPSEPCGTLAAYKRHLRNGEAPCEPCKAANAARSRARRPS